ncbi:MAG: TolC family protein [Candidatus Brocadiales bacterium]|nr:TolC family protein [Candidatus Brocadiales bacterium]
MCRNYNLPFFTPLLFILLCLTVLVHKVARAEDPEKSPGKEVEAPPEIEMANIGFKMLSVTLRDAIALAVSNNFDVEFARVSPRIARGKIIIEKSKFDPTLRFAYRVREYERPSDNTLEVAFTAEERGQGKVKQAFNDERIYSSVLESKVQSGARLELEFGMLRQFIPTFPNQTLDPDWRNFMEFRVVQPFLKDFGIFFNRSKINMAKNERKISDAELKQALVETINATQTAYWNLVRAIEHYRVTQKSLDVANELNKINDNRVEAGLLEEVELLSSSAAVAAREEDLVRAESDVRRAEDELKRVLNVSQDNLLSDATVMPLDSPPFEEKAVQLGESIKTALENRDDLVKEHLQVENSKIEVKRKRNQMLPRLDGQLGIRYEGLAGNPEDSLDSLFSEKFQDDFYSLSLEVPIGLREGRHEYANAKYKKRQAEIMLSKLEQRIVVEVKDAVRQIVTNRKRVDATRKAKKLSHKRWQIEKEKFDSGLATTFEVLTAEKELALAERNEISAIIDYNISLDNIEAKKGTILEKYKIPIEKTSEIKK